MDNVPAFRAKERTIGGLVNAHGVSAIFCDVGAPGQVATRALDENGTTATPHEPLGCSCLREADAVEHVLVCPHYALFDPAVRAACPIHNWALAVEVS